MADVSLLFNILARDNTSGGLNSASSRMDKFRHATSVAAVGILGAATAIGAKAVEIASDTAESTSKVQTLLGKSSKAALDFANSSAASFGMSKNEALASVGAMSAVQVAMGRSQADAAKLSVEYTKLSADLGSFNNASSAEVQEALTASLSGEYEMLKKYGIVVNDTTLAIEAQRIGMKKTGATWTSAQKQQLSYNIIMASTKAAQGDFARTSGGLANQTKIAAAQFQDLQGQLGAKLLPVAVKVMGAFVKLAAWIQNNQTKARVLGIVIASVAGTIVAAAVVLKAYQAAMMVGRAATMLYTGAMWLLNAAFLANPIGGVILVLVALGATFFVLWKKSETFRRIVTGAFQAVLGAASAAWGWVKSHWPLLLAIITGPIGIAVGLVIRYWDRIRGAAEAVWSAIRSGVAAVGTYIVGRFQAVVNFVRGIPGKIGDLGRVLWQHGVDLIEGFIQGILQKAASIPGVIKDKVVGVAQSALHGFGLFGSPSKLTMRYGRWWVEGFIDGTKDKAKQIEDMAKVMLDKFRAAVEKAKGIRDQIRQAFTVDLSATQTDYDGTRGPSLVERLTKQAQDAEAFVRRIAQLRKAGLRESTLQQLIAEGPGALASATEALGSVAAINAATSRIDAAGLALGNREALRQTGINLAGPNRAVVRADGKRQTVVVDVRGADKELLALFRRIVRVEGGGSVQKALGKA